MFHFHQNIHYFRPKEAKHTFTHNATSNLSMTSHQNRLKIFNIYIFQGRLCSYAYQYAAGVCHNMQQSNIDDTQHGAKLRRLKSENDLWHEASWRCAIMYLGTVEVLCRRAQPPELKELADYIPANLHY